MSDKETARAEQGSTWLNADIHHSEVRQLLSMDLNARAYGWEIGQGAPMREAIESSPGNPFLDPDWRKRL